MNRAGFVAAVTAAFAAASGGMATAGYVRTQHTPAVLVGGGKVPAWAQGLVDKLHVSFVEVATKTDFIPYVAPGALDGGWILKWAERREWHDPETRETWVEYYTRLCGPVPRPALEMDVAVDRSFFQMVTVDESGEEPREGMAWCFPYMSYSARALKEDEAEMLAGLSSGHGWNLQQEGTPSALWHRG